MQTDILNKINPTISQKQIENSRIVFSTELFACFLWLICTVFLVHYLHIESNKGFDRAAVIIGIGFFLHSLISIRYKKIFFLLLTLFLEYYLLGFKIGTGVTLLLLIFTGLTYIKKAIIRNYLVLIVTVICVLAYSKIIFIPFLKPVLLFAAPLLMLRYIYFLYELNYFKNPPVFIDRLCYFYLLPNVCFPLFPVVDPKDYLSCYYTVPFTESLKNALVNCTKGIIHLLIYRLVYLYLSPSPYEIESFGDYLQFIFSSYSFIFRLSGLFFIAIGFLQLFGFKFPLVFDHFYFAQGFTDLWRRINLYWRTFMMRVFYYPLVFRLKKFNTRIVLFYSTLVMFAVTWFLHSWQWYWIKGSFYLYPADMLFWGILGIVISFKAVYSFSSQVKNSIYHKLFSNHFYIAAKIVFVFAVISFLWSLWTSSSLTEFRYLTGFAFQGTTTDYLLFFLVILFIMLIAGFIRYFHFRNNLFSIFFKEISAYSGLFFCILLILSLQLAENSKYSEETRDFLNLHLNRKDKSMIERGYYEQLLNNDDKSIELVNIGSKLIKWDLDNKAYKKTNNELLKEFIPGFKTYFKGDSLSTNSMGLRDKEYNEKKDSCTIRMAFLGGSYVMGSGVSNSSNFAAITEDQLNADKKNNSIEILNYGAGGYHLIQCVYLCEHKIEGKDLDYLFYFVHSSDRMRCIDNFVTIIRKNVSITFPFLNEMITKTGINRNMCNLEIYNRLKPHADEIFEWGFRMIAEKCKKNGIKAVIVYLPTQANLRKDRDKLFLLTMAKNNNFHLIDLDNVYEGNNPEDIQLSSWDTHPNRQGHSLIAKKLLSAMKKDKEYFNFKK